MPSPRFELLSARPAPAPVAEVSPAPGDDELLTFDDIAAALKRHRKTVERDPFFRARLTRVGKRGVRVRRSVLRLYIHVHTAA
jgi:hypothetical protein